MKAWALSLALALAGQGFAGASEELREKRRSLLEVKKDLEEAKSELSGAQRTEKKLLGQLGFWDRKVQIARRDVKTYERNLAVIEARLKQLDARSSASEAVIAANREALKKELRLLHRIGPSGGLALLASSRDPGQAISRWNFLHRLADSALSRVSRTRASLAILESNRRENREKQDEIRGLRSQSAQARRQVELERRNRANMLEEVRRKKIKTLDMVKELKESAKDLENLVGRLRRQAQGGSSQSARRLEVDEGPARIGRRRQMPWPVRGRVVSAFGEHLHPRLKEKVFNRGIEIAAPLGADVLAAAEGRVGYAGYFEGYGNMAVLDHGGGWFTVYGHNADLEVKEGDEVSRGQKIAEVGESATLGRPTLYFEIRAQARAVNPMEWLKR